MNLLQINDCENESLGIINLTKGKSLVKTLTNNEVEVAWKNFYGNEVIEEGGFNCYEIDDFILYYNSTHLTQIERVYLEIIQA